MYLKKPPHLEPGNRVGVVSPSSTTRDFPNRLKRGLKALQNFGLVPILAKHAKKKFGSAAGYPEERAEDINQLFLRSDIQAIICSTGGYNSNSVLPFLDYKLIRKKPKIFCGFSDITALNLAIYKKSKIVTFHGPTILPAFGDYNGPFEFTARWFEKAIFYPAPLGTLEFAKEFSCENLLWERDDNKRPKTQKSSGPASIYHGKGRGILIGGNLETLSALVGTDYFPSFKGAILFLEEETCVPTRTERQLTQLEQLGIFDEIKGLLFGKARKLKGTTGELKKVLFRFAKKHSVPTIADIDCGHTKPMLTFPIGVQTSIDTTNRRTIIQESATK